MKKIIFIAIILFSVNLGFNTSDVYCFETTLPGLGETGFSLTESAIYRYFTDKDYVENEENGEDYEFINRLNLLMTKGDYTLGIRFDTDINTAQDEEYRLEKKFFQINKQSFTLELGDYYYSLGRGMVLNVVKTFEDEGIEYQIEQTILGGRLTLNNDTLSGTILGGVLEDKEADTQDSIGGGNITWNASDAVIFGFNAIGIKYDKNDARQEYEDFDQGGLGSIFIQLPSLGNWGSFYTEFSGLYMTYDDTSKDALTGWAIYSNASFYLGDWTAQIEGKRYRDFTFAYHAPPTLEPEEISILAEQFDLNTTDISGMRFRLDYSIPGTSTILYGVYSYTDDSPGEDSATGAYQTFINEQYVGVESHFNNIQLLSSIGYRAENSSEFSYSDFKGYTPHAFVSLTLPLTTRQSVELSGAWKKFNKDQSLGEGSYEFTRQEYSLGYHFSPLIAIIGTYEYDDNNSGQFTTNHKKNFYSGTLIIHPLDELYMKIFYGSTAGGVKCSSGVCKNFPAFEGLRAELVIRL